MKRQAQEQHDLYNNILLKNNSIKLSKEKHLINFANASF